MLAFRPDAIGELHQHGLAQKSRTHATRKLSGPDSQGELRKTRVAHQQPKEHQKSTNKTPKENKKRTKKTPKENQQSTNTNATKNKQPKKQRIHKVSNKLHTNSPKSNAPKNKQAKLGTNKVCKQGNNKQQRHKTTTDSE